MKNKFAVIVLAAGLGKRMKSDLSKVLHPIAGKPMLSRTISMLLKVGPSQIVIVSSPNNFEKIKRSFNKKADIAIQDLPLGTADAAKSGLNSVYQNLQTVAVVYGDDTAFYHPQTISGVFAAHLAKHATVTFVTVTKENPQGLGRIVRKNNKLVAIVEEKDATGAQKQIKEVNDGVYFFNKTWLEKNITKISPSRVTGELYLTDLIAFALTHGEKVETYHLQDASQWHPINTPEELEAANQKFDKRIHIMGIAGAGAAAVAGIAKAYGYYPTGCDLNPNSSYVKNLDIHIQKGHDKSHLASIGMLVISPAVTKLDPNNPEIKEARRLKIPVLTWQEFQGKYLQKDKFVIAVSGAYGKSTTTAMISKIVSDAGLDPTCEIGAKVLDWQSNFRVGSSKYFICEADEYNNNFLNFSPDVAVILNLGWDHPDFFKNKEAVLKSFKKFIENIKRGGYLVATREVIGAIGATRKDISVVRVEDFGSLDLSIIGDFRKENAQAALTVAKVLGLDLEKAKGSVAAFTGLGRRLEYKGKIKDVEVYDDYAVQPYTIKTTASALKAKFPDKKVVLVLEPHTFSRITTFFDEFVKSLKETSVDKILITEVYPAREKGDRKKLSIELSQEIGAEAVFSGSLAKTAAYLKQNIANFDVVLTMGAGDIYKLYDLLAGGRQGRVPGSAQS